MQNRKSTNVRKLGLEVLEQRLALAAQSWDLAADFTADFVSGLPQHNPNGVWTYLGNDGTTGSLVATNGSSPSTFGLGAGWTDASGAPSYARGGVFGFPPVMMAGHGPNLIVWTAPNDVDLGGVELTGLFTQATFEPARQVEMRIFKNDFNDPFLTVDADFSNQSAIVPLPATRVAMQPGDTLTIIIDGSGPSGNGVATFAAWNVHIQEISFQGDYNGDFVVNEADFDVWRETFGQTVPLGTVADGNKDGVIDAADYIVWRDNLGSSINPGGTISGYHPAAVIVQTTGATLPNGTSLDISGTQTQGLQEAFDYAANEGWDVFVLPGTYNLNAHLDVEEAQGRAVRLEEVTLNFSSSVTDFGIRFDSTMIVDWYWKGGALNAPNATNGVLFQPRTPHPLDGIVYGTIGVVDSRFDFGVDINAATYDVTMNTSTGPVNTVQFHFKDNVRNSVHYVGSGFSPLNVFAEARTDDPIPFDLFSAAGRVTVVPPVGEITGSGWSTVAKVYKPDGTLLITGATTTSGLKEAFDYAAANSLDLLVFGRGVRNVDPFSTFGLYNVQDTINIGPLIDRTYKIYSVTFNYTRSSHAMVMSEAVNSNFELTGQIGAVFTNTAAVVIKPITTGVVDSQIRIQHVVGKKEAFATNVVIDPSLQTIENNEFHFEELNGSYFGITVNNPSATTYFRNNLIRSLHIHAFGHIGIQLGQSVTNSSNIHSNSLQIRTSTGGVGGGAAEAGVQILGDANYINLIAVGSNLNFGIKFEPGSDGNTLYYTTLQAATPIANFGTNNQFTSGPPSDSTGPGGGAGASSYIAEEAIATTLLEGTSIPLVRMDRRRFNYARAEASATTNYEETVLLLAAARRPESKRYEDTVATDAAFDTEETDESVSILSLLPANMVLRDLLAD